MHLGLQLYLIERYTKIGDAILDPMGGSGTVLVACALGRNVIVIDLETKFVSMMWANWKKIKASGPLLGYTMGSAVILQGDSRNLNDILADAIISSPPYVGTEASANPKKWKDPDKAYQISSARAGKNNRAHGFTAEAKQRYENRKLKGLPENPNNIGNLPYGKISTIISSPPYESSEHNYRHGLKVLGKNFKGRKAWETKGKVDVICTSPPYEGTISGKELPESEKLIERKSGKEKWGKHLRLGRSQLTKYIEGQGNENIGSLREESYLQSMLTVYRNCHRVLKPEGLMILVVKPFIRDKKVVHLEDDTRKLCEKAGFVFVEMLCRKLTQVSFWRQLYQKRFPDVEKIDKEYVLVFRKK
jgi:hypothetical protein